MAGNTAGQVLGKGNSSEVHACQSDSRYVIRTVRQQDEVEWQRELSRLRRVPALSVITTIFATSGRRSLMPRLWPVPRGALRTIWKSSGHQRGLGDATPSSHRTC